MSEGERIEAAWERIERWLGEHLPGALENLRGPATADALAGLESTLPLALPEGLRASLARHDGETDNGPPNATDHWLLPADEIASHWTLQQQLAAQEGGADDTPAFWKSQIEDGIITVDGPVKPLVGSARWIPISSLNGDVIRYLDFDPAPGGTPGQVIEIDAECCSHRVLAESFAAFFERYADDLEAGRYRVEHGAIVDSREGEMAAPGMPDYLRDVAYSSWSDEEAARAETESVEPSRLAPGEQTTLVGEMGFIFAMKGLRFALHTPSGRRYVISAQPDTTRGYGSIAVEQGARVRVERRRSGLLARLAQRFGLLPIPLLALEYEMLRRG